MLAQSQELSSSTVRIPIASFRLDHSMALQRLGRFDPTASAAPRLFTKIHHDANGEIVRHQIEHGEGEVRVSVTGSEEAAHRDRWSQQFSTQNALDETLVSDHPHLKRMARRLRGIRLLRMPWSFDCAASVVLQQRVRFRDAMIGFRRIAERWGLRTEHGVAFPTARTIAKLAPYEFERLGVDAKRARALVRLAREDVFSNFLSGTDHDRLRKRLRAIPGIGPWTTEMILGFGYGDADAVPVGDLHLPSLVCDTLAGEPGGGDDRMLELLEPYRGQRFRIIRLIWAMRFREWN